MKRNTMRGGSLRMGLVAVLSVAGFAMLSVGCSGGKSEKVVDPYGELSLEDVFWEEDPSAAGCKVSAAYPCVSDSSAVGMSIRRWIDEELGGDYPGNLFDGGAMMAYYGGKRRDAHGDDAAVYGEDVSGGEYADYVQFKRVFETGAFVTFTREDYLYMEGGAHGYEGLTGAVFRKSDGRRLGWNLFSKEGLEELRFMIPYALKRRYFKVGSDDEFYEMLFTGGADGEFPLPETPPILRANGVQFVYQVYELAPYSAGLPSCTLPYSMLDSLFVSDVGDVVGSVEDSLGLTFRKVSKY